MCVPPQLLLAIPAVIKSVSGGIAARAQGRAIALQNNITSQQDLARGVAKSTERRRKADLLLGAQRVAFAKGGVDLTSGTPLLVVSETAAEEELAAQTIMSEEQQRAQDRVQRGRVARAKGEQGFRQGILGAGASLLKGASKAFPETFGPETFGPETFGPETFGGTT